MTYHDHLSTNHRNCHYRIVRTCAFHASNIGMSYYGLEHNIWCEYELFFTKGVRNPTLKSYYFIVMSYVRHKVPTYDVSPIVPHSHRCDICRKSDMRVSRPTWGSHVRREPYEPTLIGGSSSCMSYMIHGTFAVPSELKQTVTFLESAKT